MWKSYSVRARTDSGHAPKVSREPRISRRHLAFRVERQYASTLHLLEHSAYSIECLPHPVVRIGDCGKLISQFIDLTSLTLNDQSMIRKDSKNPGVEGFRFDCRGHPRENRGG
jgi:hypothetical protein